jgi:hypothetical protein
MIVFQTSHDRVDHPTPEAAIASTEAHGSGTVVAFVVTRNLPGCLPELVHSSCNMWTYNLREDAKWRGHYIFDGHGDAINEEKPN